MKKLDKLILSSFFGPFLITFFVVVFILLTQFMLRYFDEIVGKDLGVAVISQLIFYFSINMTTNALPLAVLLSSLMTFGNLGEHFELTAIKGAGISLTRTLRPIFVVICVMVLLGYFNNNFIVPKANLEAFSLLYDIKQKKPALDIKEGMFYHGIPGYSIKINHKFDDDVTLKDIIIYDHVSSGRGNKEIILADSGKMYNILNNRYLVLELFNGKSYSEQRPNDRRIGNEEEANPYLRSVFGKSKMVFSLSEFDLKRTRKDLFSNNRLMKNVSQLKTDLDSMREDYKNMHDEIEQNSRQFFKYHMKDEEEDESGEQQLKKVSIDKKTTPTQKPEDSARLQKVGREIAGRDSLPAQNVRLLKVDKENMPEDSGADPGLLKGRLAAKLKINKPAMPHDSGKLIVQNAEINDSLTIADSLSAAVSDTLKTTDSALVNADPYHKIDSLLNTSRIEMPALGQALNHIRYVKGNLASQNIQMDNMIKQIRKFTIEKYKKLSMAMTILAMFLIGAPLGAIIKRGGLGMPVLLSIVFFVLFYVISMLGEKWARQGLMTPLLGVWLANMVLFPVGLFFLKQARRDARLLDTDYYMVVWEKVKKKFSRS